MMHPQQLKTQQQRSYVRNSPRRICEKLIALDKHIMYAGFVKANGAMDGEAMKEPIAAYNRLIVMYVPLGAQGSRSLVLALTVDSNLRKVMSRVKRVVKTWRYSHSRLFFQQTVKSNSACSNSERRHLTEEN